MGEDSKIQWTDHTFNPWWGCARVSPGCEHCYAEQLATVRRKLPIWGVNAPRRMMGDAHWRQPIAWNRRAEKTRTRARVFCASMADVFEDRPELVEPRARLAALVRETPWLDWQLLTKRPENAARLWADAWGDWTTVGFEWASNVWLGTTVEDTKRRSRIDVLRTIPALVRFVSFEPLIEDVGAVDLDGIAWAIIGGESGHGAREFRASWARSLLRRCRLFGTAPFMKQFGAQAFDDITWRGSEPPYAFASRKGDDPAEWPEEFRVREFPRAA